MFTLLFVIFLILTIICIVQDDEEFACIPGCICGCLFVLMIIEGVLCVNGRVIDSKIAMYQEENINIEEDMNVLVEQYMSYESNTYGDLKNESSITLVSLYPDLKADKLVEKQIEVYTSNNEKIKRLKEKKINVSNHKWWLYFGK